METEWAGGFGEDLSGVGGDGVGGFGERLGSGVGGDGVGGFGEGSDDVGGDKFGRRGGV